MRLTGNNDTVVTEKICEYYSTYCTGTSASTRTESIAVPVSILDIFLYFKKAASMMTISQHDSLMAWSMACLDACMYDKLNACAVNQSMTQWH